MGKFNWASVSIDNFVDLNQPKMTSEEFKRHYFGVFECEPLTENEKHELSEFKKDAKEYEQRRGLVGFGYSGA